MNKRGIITLVAAVIIVAGGAFALYLALKPKETVADNSMAGMSMAPTSDGSQKSATYQQYAALKGDEYDKAFLTNMTAHHQGAIEMATLASKQASHAEVKTLATNIINAQTSEMTKMMDWQVSWGYVAKGNGSMTHPSATATTNSMSSMTDELRGLSGEAFDKRFLALMTEHHQSAIDMATPGLQNAKHQEVKDLVQAIVNAQSGEIKQMQAWQKAWGYTS